ncbi:MAG TPA: hypothetical protein VD963_11615 [Phycisphaerales bacterium]|nr:hypothetical protein [Phycisphaerales bacterium]
MPTGAGADTPGSAGGPIPRAVLSRELGGDLPCVVCGYNLRGLSVRSACPECATAVRATILAVVDPHAAELRPLARPALTAAGLVLWASGAVVAALAAWVPHAAHALATWRAGPVRHVALPWIVLGGVAVSAVGALALVRPHPGVKPAWSWMAGLAVACYLPLAWCLWRAADAPAGRYLRGWVPDEGGALARIGACLLAALIALLVRPSTRLLVARSLALRTGRVDRQTLLALALAWVTIAGGHTLWLLSGGGRSTALGSTQWLVGLVLIGLGSAFVTGGLVGALLDCVRIARAILVPAPGLAQVLGARAPGEGPA